jgi:hypothetical protein
MRRTGLLATILLLAQIGIAQHYVSHLSGDDSRPCPICMAGHQPASVPVALDPIPTAAPVCPVVGPDESPVADRLISAPLARGPPILS